MVAGVAGEGADAEEGFGGGVVSAAIILLILRIRRFQRKIKKKICSSHPVNIYISIFNPLKGRNSIFNAKILKLLTYTSLIKFCNTFEFPLIWHSLHSV